MRKVLIGLLVAGAMSLGLVAPASAKDDADGPKWAADTVCVQSSVGSEWGVKKAVKAWNALDDGPTLKLRKDCGESAGSITVQLKSNNTIYTGTTNWAYNGDNEMTDAQIYLNPKRIKKGFAANERGCMRQHTTAHEFGHALGLRHYLHSHSGSVMSYLGWKKHCGTLSAHDKSDYAALYGN